ncbi:hypothetical protein Lal_00048820 [Lupinus albus]|uniref:Putative cupredoxin n=1 Tax=Lupinus albus TaxID=3870 RepID=A0A6A5LZR6_LUPAL|nr:putative cupredoxin [Lupinus albus]KAF1864255.1 hypothetical protein Lal_00048820 [Lupinus albus]
MGEGRSNNAMIAIMLLFCMFVFHSEITHAEIYTVGGAAGWSPYVRNWPIDKYFKNGDQFVFKYNPKLYNVVKVDQAGYNACDVKNAIAVYKSGNDRVTLQSGVHFFICGIGDNCPRHGMSAVIQVEN